ncbi:phage tail terminator family protein [Peptostreptococcus faecalis]|uniref:phage tail terminator family protein n=1 Tax=Peptostreptococcus faecalis TaxID=2045015 RepID=UPI000C7E2046|nr:hypothetical protein [Peptostreptococcus faecalis]
MISKLIDAVSIQLDSYFEEITIYADENKQDFDEPCFFISLIHSMKNRMLGGRQERSYPLDIKYFDENATISELNEIGDYLYEALDLLDVEGKLIRGLDMEYKIVDNILHFFVTYPAVLEYESGRIDKMQDLKNGIGVDVNGRN